MAENTSKNVESPSRRSFLIESAATAAAAVLPGVSGCAQYKPIGYYAKQFTTITGNPDITPKFDRQKAIEDLRISVLPDIYEHLTIINGYPNESAEKILMSRLSSSAYLQVIRHENTTAVIVFQPELRRVTVAFDGTFEGADISESANINTLKHPPSGGEIREGYTNGICRKDTVTKQELHDKLWDIVNGYAEKYGRIDLTLTGFSRGGALATATAAKWFENGMPGGDKTHFADLQVFGPAAYGDKNFVHWLEKEAKLHKTKITRIIACDDAVPELSRLMKPNFFPLVPKIFDHAGDSVYLFPDKQGQTAILINPYQVDFKARIDQLHEERPGSFWHSINALAELLGDEKSYTDWDDFKLPNDRFQQALLKTSRPTQGRY